jgi:hypothetical protein
MAEKPYRFLLRMPEQLRQKLTTSAQREGRSLNSEVVHRLEESVSEPAVGRGLRVRIADHFAGVSTPARLRVGFGFAAVFLLVAVAGTAGLLRGDSGKTSAAAASLGPRLEGELPKAIERKLAQSQQFSVTTIREGGEALSDGAQDYAEHAYPADWIPYGAVKGSRADWKKHGNGGFDDNGLGGRWLSLGPDVATYPFNPFRNRFVYVPNEYVAAGRTAHSLIDPDCKPGDCRYWIANAGGGIWMTRDALAPQPEWKYLSGDFDLNNTAALAFDPNDKSHDTIYAGTGEPNICRSGCLGGVGLYRSTDGGKHWGDALGTDVFSARGIGSIAVKPGDSRTIYVATGAQGSRGISSVCCDGVNRGANIPGAPHFGLYRSQDYGKSWQLVSQGAPALCTASTPTDVFLNNTPCSPRGARRVIIDPNDANTLYASFFAKGIWRSNDSGSTWTQIFKPLTVPTAPATGADIERAEFDVAALPGGKTRMYVGVGGGPGVQAQVYRNDDVATAGGATVQAGWQNLTNDENRGYCGGQCNYDNYVYIPKGPNGRAVDPDIVYLLGSYDYNNVGVNNGRAILLSTDAGVHWTDESMDHTDPLQPHGVHPDQHSITTNPLNWRQFLETSDGGIIRSNGKFVDGSGDCTSVKQLTNATLLNRCQRLTSRIPEVLQSINAGLKTLALYQVAANPNRPGEYAGGAQDNGTWMSDPATVPVEQGGKAQGPKVKPGESHWIETFVADGASNSFDAKNPDYSTLSWQAGSLAALPVPRDQTKGFWIADSLEVIPPYVWENVPFQTQSFFDPNISMRLFTSKEHLFRSDNGGWNPAFSLATVMQHCNLWTGNGDLDEDGTYEPFTDVCDSWKPLGDPGQAGRLTYGPDALCPPAGQPLAQPSVPCPAPYAWGSDRSGGYVAFFQRAKSDNKTLWAATSTGRVFVTKNADAADPSKVEFSRVDQFSSIDPNRFPSAIWVSSTNPNQAIVSYSGYNALTPTTPGHVFGVTFDPVTKQATWVRMDDDLGDLPVADVQVDEQRHVLYASTDFGVLKLRLRGNGGPFRGADKWRPAGPGLPAVNVPDLTILPDRGVLLAATHGFGAWTLKLQG